MPPEPAPPAHSASDRLIGWLAVLAGTVLAFGLQVANPVGVPLYDGVAVQEPYRFLHPTGDQPGSPTSFSATVPVAGSESPQVTAATHESPTQAQLVALPGAFSMAPGATSLSVSVTPVEAPVLAAGGQIAGNVYRFTIVDQNGAPVTVRPCEGCLTLVLRAPEDMTGPARLQRYANGAWTDVQTVHAEMVGLYYTNPTALGDFAVVTGGEAGPTGGPNASPGAASGGSPALDGVVVAAGAAVILVLLFVAALVLRRRPVPVPEPPRSRAVPSKRRRPPKPPVGGPES